MRRKKNADETLRNVDETLRNTFININLYFCDVENFIKNTIKKLTSPRNKNTIKNKAKYLKQILMRHKCHGTRHTAGHKDKEKKANI